MRWIVLPLIMILALSLAVPLPSITETCPITVVEVESEVSTIEDSKDSYLNHLYLLSHLQTLRKGALMAEPWRSASDYYSAIFRPPIA